MGKTDYDFKKCTPANTRKAISMAPLICFLRTAADVFRFSNLVKIIAQLQRVRDGRLPWRSCILSPWVLIFFILFFRRISQAHGFRMEKLRPGSPSRVEGGWFFSFLVFPFLLPSPLPRRKIGVTKFFAEVKVSRARKQAAVKEELADL